MSPFESDHEPVEGLGSHKDTERLVLKARTAKKRTKILTAVIRAAMRGYMEELKASFSEVDAFLDKLDAWADGRMDAPEVCRSIAYKMLDAPGLPAVADPPPPVVRLTDVRTSLAGSVVGTILGMDSENLEDDDDARSTVASVFMCLEDSFASGSPAIETLAAMVEAARRASKSDCEVRT